MTHTPGPWKFYNAYGSRHILFTRMGNDDETILESARAGIDTWIASEDDARLIAAAPDLLEACERLAALYSKHNEWDEVKAARAAIAKAKGGDK